MHLIGLVGFKGSGKDTAGRFLVQNYGFHNFSFAESLKDALASIFCWDRALLEGDTGESRAWRETVDSWWSEKLDIPNFTPRLAMQLIGTEVFRQHFNTDLWILNIERKLSMLPSDAKVVLYDGRFPNELDLGRRYGGRIVRVKRGPEPEWFNVAQIANLGSPELIENEWGSFDPSVKEMAREAMDRRFKIHESEWAWIGQPVDFVIENDKTIDHLHQEILKVCL